MTTPLSVLSFGFSPAAGLKGGQFDRKRNFGLAGSHTRIKSEYRLSINEYRMSKDCILSILLKELSKAKLTFDILRFACFKIDKAKRHHYSMFSVGRSMFSLFAVPTT